MKLSKTNASNTFQTECDAHIAFSSSLSLNFYPRTPNGVRRKNSLFFTVYHEFLSTHSKRSATEEWQHQCPNCGISIHALQTECDWLRYLQQLRFHISIHALQTECDQKFNNRWGTQRYFYPRTPNGVRQFHCCTPYSRIHHFYPRTPNGVRQDFFEAYEKAHQISIHALQTECDRKEAKKRGNFWYFYPRTPNGVRP